MSETTLNYEWISQSTRLSQEDVQAFFAKDRLFPFALDEGRIYPGTVRENETVLFLLETHRLLRLTFDTDRRLASHAVHTVPEEALPWFGPKRIGTGDLAIPDFRQNNAGFFHYLCDEFSYNPERIDIRQFTVDIDPHTTIYIDRLPMVLADFIQDPSDISCFDDLDAACESLRHWIVSTQFVLEWGTDYWIDSVGEICST